MLSIAQRFNWRGLFPYLASFFLTISTGTAHAIPLGQLANWPQGLLPNEIASINVPPLAAGTAPNIVNVKLPAPTPFAVTLFRASPQKPFTMAIKLDSMGAFSLAQQVPALRSTPLNDITFKNVYLLLVPPGSQGQTLLPGDVAAALGMRDMQLTEGTTFIGSPTFTGAIRSLLDKIGAPISSAKLLGTFDPTVLFASSSTQLLDKFMSTLNINQNLGSIRPSWTAGFLGFQNTRLSIKTVNRAVLASASADILVSAGTGQPIVFTNTAMALDNGSGTLSLSGGPTKLASGALGLPSNIATLDTVSFTGSVQGANKSFTLSGAATIMGKPDTLTLALSGSGTRANYAVSLPGARSLADVLGWPAPGLESVSISNFSFNSGDGTAANPSFSGGTLQIGSDQANIVVFNPGGANPQSIAAITLPSLHLPDIVPQLKGSPLDGMKVEQPGLILAPPGFSARVVGLPALVSAQLGAATYVSGGLNLKGRASPSGEVADLFKAVGLSSLVSQGIPLFGSLDPRVLQSGTIGADVAKSIMASIDIKTSVGTLSLPGISPTLLSATNSQLWIKGNNDGRVMAALIGPIALKAGNQTHVFNSAITLVKQANTIQTTITGRAAAPINAAFGISWLKLDQVGLAVTLGAKNSITVSGTTSVGNSQGLTASVFVDAQGSQVSDFGVALTGADIALGDIPGFGKFNELSDIKFSNLVASSTELAGTLKTSNVVFNNLRAAVFKSGNGLNLVAMRENFKLENIVPLPKPAKDIFDGLKIDKGMLVISQAGIQGAISTLPKSTAALLTEVYGDPSRQLKMGNGFNLSFQMDPNSMGKGISALGMGSQKFLLSGGVQGVFGGTPSFNLSAPIPPIKFPSSLNFLDLPPNLQTAFFSDMTQTGASMGVSVSGDFPLKTKQGKVYFTNAMSLALDPQGGVTIELSGTAKSPWVNPMGIPGITLDQGTAMKIGVSATSQVDITFVGKSKIGSKQIDIAGTAGVLPAALVIDKAAFQAKISEMGLNDLVAMSSAAATAVGGKPPTINFPTARLTNLDLAFASPGATLPGVTLSGGGSKVAGDLWLIRNDKPLGSVLAQVDANGMVISGALSDFAIGPVQLTGNQLDARATTSAPPFFKIKSGAKMFGATQNAELMLSPTEMELAMALNMGALLQFDVRAKGEIPLQGMNPSQLAQSDMALNATLSSDIPAWLRGAGREPIDRSFDTVRQGLSNASADLKKAQDQVNSINQQIDNARNQVRQSTQSAQQKIDAAQNQVNNLQNNINSLTNQINSANGNVRSCNYTFDQCYLWDWRGRCTKSKAVPDGVRNASCESDNTYWRGVAGSKTTERAGVYTAKATADQTLQQLKNGLNTVSNIDLDPLVAPLILARDAALVTLKAAEDAVAGANKATGAIKTALDAFAKSDAFILQQGSVQGSLQKAIAGKPVVMALSFSSFGKPYNFNLAYSLTDPVFNAKQLAVIGLFIANNILKATYGNDVTMAPFLVLVDQAYSAAQKDTASAFAAAKKDSGLE